MKKRFVVIIIFLFCFICIHKIGIITSQLIGIYVKYNSESLEEHATTLLKTAREGEQIYSYGKRISCYKDEKMIEYCIQSNGVILEGCYRGFYYSGNNIPIFRCLKQFTNEHQIVEKNNGWVCIEHDSDNWEYTKKIVDRWFYYEIHY